MSFSWHWDFRNVLKCKNQFFISETVNSPGCQQKSAAWCRQFSKNSINITCDCNVCMAKHKYNFYSNVTVKRRQTPFLLNHFSMLSESRSALSSVALPQYSSYCCSLETESCELIFCWGCSVWVTSVTQEGGNTMETDEKKGEQRKTWCGIKKRDREAGIH